jgi:hypothetical protein
MLAVAKGKICGHSELKSTVQARTCEQISICNQDKRKCNHIFLLRVEPYVSATRRLKKYKTKSPLAHDNPLKLLRNVTHQVVLSGSTPEMYRGAHTENQSCNAASDNTTSAAARGL